MAGTQPNGASLVNTHVAGDKHIQLWRERRASFEGRSTSSDAYVQYGRVEQALPSSHAKGTSISIRESGHFYGETTSRSAYQQPPPQSRTYEQLEQKYEPSNAKFYGSTTSADTYKYMGGRPAEPSATAKASSIPIKEGSAFYGESTSMSAFAAPAGAERVIGSAPDGKSLDGVLSTGDGVGYFDTTSRQAYVAFPSAKREEAPKVVYEPNKAYFYGSTTSGEAFQAWSAEKPARAQAPVHRADSGPFYGSTTNREAFVAYQCERQGPIAPSGNLRTEGSFSGVTTSQESFRGWQLPKQRQSLGLETVNDSFFVMIPRNMSFPTSFTQCFTTVTDQQTAVEIVVRQGDSLRASENAVLGQFELVGIPAGRVGDSQIQVTFHINDRGILHVDARDPLTGKRQAIAIDKTKNAAAFQPVILG